MDFVSSCGVHPAEEAPAISGAPWHRGQARVTAIGHGGDHLSEALVEEAVRPPFMAVMDLLADPVTVAGAVSLDVEVPVSGVRRIRTGPQDGREPTACSGSQRCENSHLSFVLRFSNRKDFAVREFETRNIHRQATRMGAEL